MIFWVITWSRLLSSRHLFMIIPGRFPPWQKEALAMFKATPDQFDLIITDLTMPDLTGFQLSEQIYTIRQDIPIILCTGFGEHINRKKFHEQGIRGFLNKPVSVKEVSNLIRDILDETIRD